LNRAPEPVSARRLRIQDPLLIRPETAFSMSDRERRWEMEKKGLVQIYTGEGKGKTTASLGQAFRAFGRGWRVRMIQFMKAPDSSGEHFAVKELGDNFRIIPVGRKGFIYNKKPSEKDIELAQGGLNLAREALADERVDLVILDEIDVALSFGLISEEDVLGLMEDKRESIELIMTGRNALPSLMEKADLVTEMRMVKHPYRNGVLAREGIEY